MRYGLKMALSDPMSKDPGAKNEPLIKRLNLALKMKGISARAASLQSGQNADAVRSILNGSTFWPQAYNLAKLADVLDVDLKWLITGKGAPDREMASELVFEPELMRAVIIAVHQYAAMKASTVGETYSPQQLANIINGLYLVSLESGTLADDHIDSVAKGVEQSAGA